MRKLVDISRLCIKSFWGGDSFFLILSVPDLPSLKTYIYSFYILFIVYIQSFSYDMTYIYRDFIDHSKALRKKDGEKLPSG